MLFGNVVLTWELGVITLLAVLVVWAGVSLYWRKDTEKEKRHKGYSELSNWLKEAKFPRFSDIFLCLSVDDKSGAYDGVKHLVTDVTTNPANRLALLTENFYWQLEQRLSKDDDLPKIAKAVQAKLDVIAAAKAKEAAPTK
jgi:hypothetical protein